MTHLSEQDARDAIAHLIEQRAAGQAALEEALRVERGVLRIIDGYCMLFPEIRAELPPEVAAAIGRLPQRAGRPRKAR